VDVAVYDPLTITGIIPTGNLNEWRVMVAGGVPFTGVDVAPYRIEVDGVVLDEDTFVIDVTRLYTVQVTDSLTAANSTMSCPVTEIVELTFVDLFIPNYFTPDGDGTYDTWYPENTEFFPDIKLRVFDRYGRLLSQFKGPVLGWDGKYQNKVLPSGDYWYTIDLNDGDHPKRPLKDDENE